MTPPTVFFGILTILFILTVMFLTQWAGLYRTLSGFNVQDDAMYFSGFLTILPALWLSLRVDAKFNVLALQIERDHLIFGPDGHFTDIYRGWLRRIRIWQRNGAICVGGVVVIGYGYFYFLLPVFGHHNTCQGLFSLFGAECREELQISGYLDWIGQVAIFIFVSALLACMVGHRLGTMGALGNLNSMVEDADITIRVDPAHSDGVGGFAKFGGLIAYQGILVSVPIMWLSVWSGLVLQDAPEFQRYRDWFLPFLAQFAVASFFFYFAFLRPFFAFTRRYRAEKLQLLEFSFAAIEEAENKNNHERILSEQRNAALIQQLPNYPIAPNLGRLFAFSAAMPLFNLALEVAVPQDSPFIMLFDFLSALL
ncbi:hypothetical protein [Candidatus Rhodobacter oscarellae]|uniref:hypothetical protein n=1 Tax=Candidatus Rhodobacter oscarellae TaxID=1675527 RepID=UPI00128FB44A|nr:hypothetical protein [Candidatus Rhodobacter lobularis]